MLTAHTSGMARKRDSIDITIDCHVWMRQQERKLGEILKRMAASGEREKHGGDRKTKSRANGRTVKLRS